jgi:16S rRNA (uracil1498-N3)-methyltransferase
MANNTRFFVNNVILCGTNIVLIDSIIRHFFALRLKKGDYITLFNGDGFDYNCLILAISKQHVELLVQYAQLNNCELPVHLNLMMSLIQRENFELVLQKSVEIGVSKITPIYSDFSQRIEKSKLENRLLRWQQIIINATEQCGRNIIPEIVAPIHLTQIMENFNHVDREKSCNIVCDFAGKNHILDLNISNYNNINLLVGPEGGFSVQELSVFSNSFRHYGINLGKQILRAETASIVALGLLSQKIQYSKEGL